MRYFRCSVQLGMKAISPLEKVIILLKIVRSFLIFLHLLTFIESLYSHLMFRIGHGKDKMKSLFLFQG